MITEDCRQKRVKKKQRLQSRRNKKFGNAISKNQKSFTESRTLTLATLCWSFYLTVICDDPRLLHSRFNRRQRFDSKGAKCYIDKAGITKPSTITMYFDGQLSY